jgi:excisionase family DNA binding protein
MTTVNPEPVEFEQLIDLPTLARWLGVKERHIRRLVSERRIPFHKWGHHLRFDPVDVRDWLATHRIDPTRRPLRGV